MLVLLSNSVLSRYLSLDPFSFWTVLDWELIKKSEYEVIMSMVVSRHGTEPYGKWLTRWVFRIERKSRLKL